MMNNIPREYFNDSQFVNTFISTFCREIIKLEESHSNVEKIISEIKEKISKSLEMRKGVKQMLELEKKKKEPLEVTLQTLIGVESGKTAELTLIKGKLDEKSLNNKADLEKYQEIVKMYKETWLARQAEYEKIMPLANDRRQAKIDLQQLEIKSMILKQKKEEFIIIQQQKWKIDERRLQIGIIKSVEAISQRWKKQKQLEYFIIENSKCRDEIKSMTHLKQKLLHRKSEEMRSKLKARQLITPPELDLSSIFFNNNFPRMNSILASPLSNNRYSIDSDSISINTVMYEEMCRNDDQRMEIIEDASENHVKIVQKPVQPEENHPKEIKRPAKADDNIETLEEIYSQLSIEKDPPVAPIEIQVIIEEKPKKSNLKAFRKPVTSKGPPEPKKAKLTEESEKKVSEKNRAEAKPRELPKIQAVEMIAKPIAVVPKPLVAEVTPRPSSLFSPRHYAPSCVDSEISETVMNDIDEAAETINKWKNLSPQGNLMGSEASFMSNISDFKFVAFDEDQGTSAFPDMGFFNMFPDNEKLEGNNKSSKEAFTFF